MRRRGFTLLELMVVLLILALIASIAATIGGAISALGPVDADGNGDTTADVRCIEP